MYEHTRTTNSRLVDSSLHIFRRSGKSNACGQERHNEVRFHDDDGEEMGSFLCWCSSINRMSEFLIDKRYLQEMSHI